MPFASRQWGLPSTPPVGERGAQPDQALDLVVR